MAPAQKDYGEFALKTSRNDDFKLLRAGIEMARANPTKPGHHWHRIVAKDQGGPLEIIKLYHVDLHAGVAEITETRNGEETARRTIGLADLG